MISKLTPKTWQVRNAYIFAIKSSWISEQKAHFKFTKWLLKEQRRCRNIGKAQERKRIIALLEESRVYLVDGVLQPTAFINISDAISLIKEENE